MRRRWPGEDNSIECQPVAGVVRTLRLAAILIAVAPLVRAGVQAQYFGQNKVPGHTREWRVLESEHVCLHFYPEERETAREALALAERACGRLSQFLAHKMEKPISIILYASQSEFEETRAIANILSESTGGVTEFYKRRVILPQSGSLSELDHVLTHELAHSFEIDILGRGRRGDGVPALSWMPPLWLIEGLAEYLSVPGVDPQTEMWLRDAISEGELPSIDELSHYGDLRVYRYGQSLVAYVAETFGDDAIGLWLRTLAARHDFEDGTREALGASVDRLSADWSEALRKRYFPEAAARPTPEQAARRLTDREKRGVEFFAIPSISPDGREMVYVASTGLYSDLHLASAIDGAHRERLIRGYRNETFESLRFATTSVAWSPDGKQIAFAAKTDGREKLLLYDLGTRKVTRAFALNFDELRSPSWSPDGKEIVFVGLREGRAGLYRMRISEGRPSALNIGAGGVLHPAWSPDGGRIAFATDQGYASATLDRDRSIWRIAWIDIANGNLTVLPDQPGRNIDPQWSPDGREILYRSDRTGSANLFVRDLDSGRDRQITDLRNGISGVTPLSHAVALSANGKRAVFSAFHRGGWDLFAIEDPLADSLAIARPPLVQPTALQATTPGSPLADEADASAAVPVDTLPAARLMPVVNVADSAATAPPATLAEVYEQHDLLPDTLRFSEKDYSPRLTIDYASAGGLYASGFGFLAETAIVLSDMLGDRVLVLAADVNGSLEEGDYFVGYLNQGRRPAVAVSAYQDWSGYGYGSVPGFIEQYEVRAVRGAGVGLIYPLSRFQRMELSLDGIHERRQRYVYEDASGAFDEWVLQDEVDEAWYALPEAAWVYDSAIFGSTGPLSGRRARLSVMTTLGERRRHGFSADYRSYLNIRRRYAFALRSVFAGDWGADRARIVFGGPYSLRGYTDDPLAGARIAFVNLEFRFPFIDRLRLGWPVPLEINGVRGALFLDGGAAWDDAADLHPFRADGKAFRLDDVKAAAGFRAAINVGFAVIRWDLTRRTDLSRWIGKTQGEVSIGWEF